MVYLISYHLPVSARARVRELGMDVAPAHQKDAAARTKESKGTGSLKCRRLGILLCISILISQTLATSTNHTPLVQSRHAIHSELINCKVQDTENLTDAKSEGQKRRISTCALAAVTVAAGSGLVPVEHGLSATYNGSIVTLYLNKRSGFKIRPMTNECNMTGQTKIRVRCSVDYCVSLVTGQVMTVKIAVGLVTVDPVSALNHSKQSQIGRSKRAADMDNVFIVPNPYTYEHCAMFNRRFCPFPFIRRPYCPALCLSHLAHPEYRKFINSSRARYCRELFASLSLPQVEIPRNYRIDWSKTYECYNRTGKETDGSEMVGQFQGKCGMTIHLDRTWNAQTPSRQIFQAAASHSDNRTMFTPQDSCEKQTWVLPPMVTVTNQVCAVENFYWICGGTTLRSALPLNWTGLCARVLKQNT